MSSHHVAVVLAGWALVILLIVLAILPVLKRWSAEDDDDCEGLS